MSLRFESDLRSELCEGPSEQVREAIARAGRIRRWRAERYPLSEQGVTAQLAEHPEWVLCELCGGLHEPGTVESSSWDGQEHYLLAACPDTGWCREALRRADGEIVAVRFSLATISEWIGLRARWLCREENFFAITAYLELHPELDQCELCRAFHAPLELDWYWWWRRGDYDSEPWDAACRQAAHESYQQWQAKRKPSGPAPRTPFQEKAMTPTDDNGTLEWCDRPGPRRRRAWLLLIHDGAVYPFAGDDLADAEGRPLAVVQRRAYEKNGQWSSTTFQVALAPGVTTIAGRDGWESGTFAEGLAAARRCSAITTWPEMAHALGVGVPEARRFLIDWRPGAARILDTVEQKLLNLDETAETVDGAIVKVVVSFGSPTRRQRADGFWLTPKPLPEPYKGELALIDPALGWSEKNVRVLGVAGRVLRVKAAGGYGGGYVSITVALADEGA